MLEAFNKLSNQQKSLQEQLNNPRASATVSKPPSHSVDQLDADSVPGTSQVSYSNPRHSDPRDTGVTEFAGPSLGPSLGGGVSDPLLDHSYRKRGSKHKKHKDKRKHKSTKYISLSSEQSDTHHELFRSCTGDQPDKNKSEPQGLQKSMSFGDLKQKDTDPKPLLTPDPIIPRNVDISDLPSDYTQDIEPFRQVLNIPDPRDSMPIPSASVWGLNKVA